MTVRQDSQVGERIEVLATARRLDHHRRRVLKTRPEPCRVDTQLHRLGEQRDELAHQFGLEVDLHCGLGNLERSAGQFEPGQRRQFQRTESPGGTVQFAHSFKDDFLLRHRAD
jgi:hypothetical protein